MSTIARLIVSVTIGILSSMMLWAQPSVVTVSCSGTVNETTIAFTADSTIATYQRPEVSGNTIVFRIPDSKVGSDFAPTGCSNIAIRQRQIREFAVFTITCTEIVSVNAKRLSATSVCLVITTNQTGGGDKPKPPSPNETAKSKPWSLDVIVIDAGHGGKDVGAIGVNGVFEKDITLSIAKKLRALILKNMPDTKVVLTRTDDTFVELFRRTQIANDAKGKLFISIHCNSMPTIPHPARGCETYILRPGRNEDAARVAKLENASIQLEKSSTRYAEFDADQLIVATMAQRSFVRYSEELASRIQKHVASYTNLQDRGVSQAGFFVLVGASMPNVLFETAFLSNEDDAKFISSARGQQRTAEGMLRALTEYVEMYETSLR